MVSRGATRNQEGACGVQKKGQKQRARRFGGAVELGESVQCLSGQWLFLEERTAVGERRQYVQSHLGMEQDGAGTSQARERHRPALMRKQTWVVATRGEAARKSE